MPAAVICLETFRAERNRQKQQEEPQILPARPFLRSLRSVLGDQQIAHRRAILAYFDQVKKEEVVRAATPETG
jgi:hypothetical protein